jgi:hypothetical protein
LVRFWYARTVGVAGKTMAGCGPPTEIILYSRCLTSLKAKLIPES